MNAQTLIKSTIKFLKPYAKPVARQIAKSILLGVAGTVAQKAASAFIGDIILSERDKDIRRAFEQDVKLKQEIALKQQQLDELKKQFS